jgi:hypothetical protein
MGHFSVEIYTTPGSTLSANQHKIGNLEIIVVSCLVAAPLLWPLISLFL